MKKQKHFTVCRWTPRVWTKGGGGSENKYFHNAFFAGDSGLYLCIFRYILYWIFPRDQNPLSVRMPIARYPHRVIYTSGETRLSSGHHIFYGTFSSWPSIFRFWKTSTPDKIDRINRKNLNYFCFKKNCYFQVYMSLFPCIRLERGTGWNSGNPKRFMFVIV